jgi:adenylate cyclase
MTAAAILRANGPLVEVRTRNGVAAISPPGAIPAVEVAAVLAALGCAAAVADPVSGAVLAANARFNAWFPGAATAPLMERLRLPDAARAHERLAHGRTFRQEVEVQPASRAFTALVEVRVTELAGHRVTIAEANDVSARKEAEYMLDSYARLMERQARALEREKSRVERMLRNLMPRRVFDEFRDFGASVPQSFESATVLLIDFVDFTDMAIAQDPRALVSELNEIFTAFDHITERFHCERVRTIGDAYMAVGGIAEDDPDHAVHMAQVALAMRRFIERRNASGATRWRYRIGIGSGSVVGAIIGTQRYVYDVFGPPVNLAARLERLCEPNQILISGDVAAQLGEDFVMRPIGATDVKGFGIQQVHALEDERRPHAGPPPRTP